MSIGNVLNDLFVNTSAPRKSTIFSDSEDNINTMFEKAVQESILQSIQQRFDASEWDTFKEVYINNPSDENFAKQLENSSGEDISTEKSINWAATGESILTDEQIGYLKAEYEIENMTCQDYYNLMADLTNMNAISGKDLAKYHADIALDLSQGAIVPVDGKQDFSMFFGDILSNSKERLDHISKAMNASLDNNRFESASDYIAFKQFCEEQMSLCVRFTDIFEKLVL